MANHTGSARAFEVVDKQRIFQRTIEKHGLRNFLETATLKVFLR